MLRVYAVMGTLPLPRQVARLCAEQHQHRKFFACQYVGAWPLHIPLAHSRFQRYSGHLLGEAIRHSRTGLMLG